jgi:hypothetical protein
VTAEQDCILAVGDQKVGLYCKHGWTKRKVVDGICMMLRTLGEPHPRFLDSVTVTGTEITFSLSD